MGESWVIRIYDQQQILVPPLECSGTIELGRQVTFDQLVLAEDIARGQRVESFTVAAWDGDAWDTIVTDATIGFRRIEALAAPVTTDRLRISVLSARARPSIGLLGLYTTVASS